MPRSRGRKRVKESLNQDRGQSSTAVQTKFEARSYQHLLKRLAFLLSYWTRLLAAILLHTLRVSLGWLWNKKGDILLWSSVAMTLVAGGFFFLPRVTVEPSGPYDSLNPSPITFRVSNTNIIPLKNVDFSIGICFLSLRPGKGVEFRGEGSGFENKAKDCNGPAQSKLVFAPWSIKWLDVDEKYEIALEEALKSRSDPRMQIERANMTIGITYTPWRLPFLRSTREFRFVTTERSDGKIYWVPVPLNR